MVHKKLESVRLEPLQDGSGVLIQDQSSKALVVNAMGCILWELVDGQRAKEEIVSIVCETLNVDPGSGVDAEIAQFFEKLHDFGFLRTVS